MVSPVTINKSTFTQNMSQQGGYINVSQLPQELSDQLKARGISKTDLENIAGPNDQVISGKEFDNLFDRLTGSGSATGAKKGELSKADKLYQALLAESGKNARKKTAQPATPTPAGPPKTGLRTEIHGQPKTPSPNPADAVPKGWEGRTRKIDGKKTEDTHSVTTDAVRKRAGELMALEPSTSKRHVAVKHYVETAAAVDRRAELRSSGHRRAAFRVSRPKGTPARIWNMAQSLRHQGISTTDVAHYVATGQLPDLADENGKVLQTGAQRLAQLEKAATKRGSWTAVNTFTFLVSARRSAMAAERQVVQKRIATLPADSTQRKEAEAAIQASEAHDKALGKGLQTIYRMATYARERSGHGCAAVARRYTSQAAEARKAGDTGKAEKLEAKAQRLRDRAARILSAEGTYRAKIRGYGRQAASAFQGAASAQIDTGHAKIAAMQSGRIPLSKAPPPELGDGDGTTTSNGVAGAGHLLSSAATADPKAAKSHRHLALQGSRNGALAVFHQTHLQQGGYFDRGTKTQPPKVRSEALIQHRKSYVRARGEQIKAADQRLGLYGDRTKLSGGQALDAAAVASERRQLVDDLNGSQSQALASERAAKGAKDHAASAKKGLEDAKKGERDANKGVSGSKSGVQTAKDQDAAVFGDTFKSDGSARRDNEGVTDAEAILSSERARAQFTRRRREAAEKRLKDANTVVGQATTLAARDKQDAALVRGIVGTSGVVSGPTGTAEQAYRSLRGESDRMARLGAGYVDQAAKKMPKKGPERARAQTALAAANLDLSRYWTSSAESNAHALGKEGRSDATDRLDTAAKQIDRADIHRTALPKDDKSRPGLASLVVDARAGLAEANADYRPHVSHDQLKKAEGVVKTDLAGHPDRAKRARGRIGSAAVASYMRSDVRLDQIVKSGNYKGGARDGLYQVAHRNLKQGACDDTARVKAARGRLGEIDRNYQAVSKIFGAAAQQLQNGQRYAAAQTRGMGRSEIKAAQAQVSTVIHGLAYVVSIGHIDMHGEMADAGELSTKHRVSRGRHSTERYVKGANEMAVAWQKACKEGRQAEFLDSVRIFSNEDNKKLAPQAYRGAFMFIHTRTPEPLPGLQGDWQDFNRMAIRGKELDENSKWKKTGGVPVARALAGPTMGLDASYKALGDSRLGVLSADHTSMMGDQAKSLKQTTDGMGWIIAANVTLEVALGIVATGGLGSAGAAANGANALNAGRTGLQAMQAVKTMGQLARAGRALQAFRAAHPILSTIAVTGVVGGGMYGASRGARALFGASSPVTKGFDVAANFVPIGVGQKVAGVAGAAERAAVASGKASLLARGADGVKRSFSKANLLAHARFYGPQLALGGGQAFATSLAVPVLADKLGIRSEAGQAALGMALGALFAGGTAGVLAARRGGNFKPADRAAAHLMAAGDDVARKAAPQVRAEVQNFLTKTKGRAPTAKEVSTFRASLMKRLNVPEGSAGASRRQHVDATVDALCISQIGKASLAEARGAAKGKLTSAQAVKTVDLMAQRWMAAGGKSRSQAYRDAANFVARETGDPKAAMAALDRARAAELAESFHVPAKEGAKPVIKNPQQRAKVESILAGEMGGLRRSVDGDGAGPADSSKGSSAYQKLSQRLQKEAGLTREGAESVLRGVQQDLVERGIRSRLVSEQAKATKPLTEQQIAKIGREVAERAGVDKATATKVGNDLAKKSGVVDWVRSWLPPKHWTADQHRQNFLDTSHPYIQGKMKGLTAKQLAAVYPEGGPYPESFRKASLIPHFAELVAKDPKGARLVADALQVQPQIQPHLDAAAKQGYATLVKAVAHLRAKMPTVSPTSNKNYIVLRRPANGLSSMPAANIRTTRSADGNGAFHQRAIVPKRVKGERPVSTYAADPRTTPPAQLMGKDGKPLTDLSSVVVLSGHGGRTGFSGLSNKQAVNLVADEVVRLQGQGRKIDYVQLDACHQRDRRGFLLGGSNAQAFQRMLTAELARRGVKPTQGQKHAVTVLAAERGGPTYGTGMQASWMSHPHKDASGKWKWGKSFRDTRFLTADQNAKFYMAPEEAALAATVGGMAAGGVLVYRAVQDKKEDKKQQPPPPPPKSDSRPVVHP